MRISPGTVWWDRPNTSPASPPTRSASRTFTFKPTKVRPDGPSLQRSDVQPRRRSGDLPHVHERGHLELRGRVQPADGRRPPDDQPVHHASGGDLPRAERPGGAHPVELEPKHPPIP